jgi:4-hydroxy-3-methylbut-2-en-1-yl diphosphate synthase IspG/GcpE
MQQRRPTRQVIVGDERVGYVKIGGGAHGTEPAPVSVQTMTAGYTYEIDACVAEINRLAAAGADMVRVAVPEKKDTDALARIIPQVRVPIVADVHFHFQRALEAIEAGVHKIRLYTASAAAQTSHLPSGSSTVPNTSLVSMMRFIRTPTIPAAFAGVSPEIGEDWTNLAPTFHPATGEWR